MLVLIVLAKLSGADTPTAIAEWVRLRRQVLVEAFGCERERVPCLNTIRTILGQVVSLEALHQRSQQYLYEAFGGQQGELVSVDGKTLRGTIPPGSCQGVHLLAAFVPQEGLVLGQLAVGQGENEISVAPRLLGQLDLRQRVVCGDAMLTQREIALAVRRQGGESIGFLKENQPTLKADVEQFFHHTTHAPAWLPPPLPTRQVTTYHKGHGRLEKRVLTCLTDEAGFLRWPAARQLFRLERTLLHPLTGHRSQEYRYGLTSLNPHSHPPARLLPLIRPYWRIENGLHYRRDVTLREDATRFSSPRMAEAMAIVNNFIIGLAHKLGFDNLAAARRVFDASLASQLFAPHHF